MTAQQVRRIQRQQSTSRRSDRQAAVRRDAPRTAAHTGRPEEKTRPGERRRLWQLSVSALILVLVVACKLALPDVTEQYRGRILALLGENTDFVEAFSSVGRMVSPDGTVGEALNDAYTAVFGVQDIEEEDQTADTESSDSAPQEMPENVCMTQQVLGFAYQTPVSGTITSAFGYREHPIEGEELFHYGLDIGADSGTVISAFAAGTVTAVGESSALGKYLVIAHANDCSTLYAHCSRITASSGQQVAMGDPIAEVGQTGEATGSHLHFELQQGNTYLNPVYYVTP